MTKTNKIALNEDIKIGRLFFDSSQFDIPSELFVDFTSARPSSYDEDGNQSNDVQKYTLNGIEVSTGQVLASANVDLSKFEGVPVGVSNDLDSVEKLIDSNYIGTVKLVNPRVKPLWVSRGNSGAFKKLKLVVDSISKVTSTTTTKKD